MIVEWIPSWYELDQCIVAGDVDLFYLSNENCFADDFNRDAYEVRAEILTINHKQLGRIKGIITTCRRFDKMIYVDKGKEQEQFISFVEQALSILAEENYAAFLTLFDSSRLEEQDLIFALKYLDESRSVVKIDNPIQIKCDNQIVDIHNYNDASGYWMDYDLTTDGEPNDLTIQIEFLKKEEGYLVVLDDLHTL